MRIVLLITMGLQRPGGVRYFHLARAFVQRGHRVRIVALHPDFANCHQRKFVQDGVEVWYVGQMHARKQATVPTRFGALALLQVLARSTLGMVWAILCSPADVYHLGKPQPINGMAALLGVALLRWRRFYVDWDDDEVRSNRLTAGWQRAVFAFWQWLLLKLAAGVTVNTHFLANRLRKRGIDRYAYVPNGVDLDRFKPLDPQIRAALRAALGLERGIVIAYAGTVALHNHPVDLLVRAFAQLSPALPAAQLILIGGGEDGPRLHELSRTLGIADRVRATGQIAHVDVPLWLALADVSVDPVRADDVARARSPLKLAESMALGVPVITGDVGDRRAVLGAGAGWLVEPGSVEALADALRYAAIHAMAREAAGQAARTTARHYTWQQVSAAWLALYTADRAERA